MPRTRLGEIYSPETTPLPAKPKVEPKVERVSGEVSAQRDLRKIPSTNFWVDKNTGVMYLDKAMLDVL